MVNRITSALLGKHVLRLLSKHRRNWTTQFLVSSGPSDFIINALTLLDYGSKPWGDAVLNELVKLLYKRPVFEPKHEFHLHRLISNHRILSLRVHTHVKHIGDSLFKAVAVCVGQDITNVMMVHNVFHATVSRDDDDVTVLVESPIVCRMASFGQLNLALQKMI